MSVERAKGEVGWIGADPVIFRAPGIDDGKALWALARDSGALDLNSPYAYLMVGDLFAQTSAVAEQGGKIIGFASALRRPDRADTLFVWQIAVEKQWRGAGLATGLLRDIVMRQASTDICYIEATITPDNVRSFALFEGVARKLGTSLVRRHGFDDTDFPDGHAAEIRVVIGPF